jgi:hypothetical protein
MNEKANRHIPVLEEGTNLGMTDLRVFSPPADIQGTCRRLPVAYADEKIQVIPISSGFVNRTKHRPKPLKSHCPALFAN